MKRFVVAAVGLGLLVSGCTAVVPADAAPSLAGTSWVVTQLNSGPTLPGNRPSISFDGEGHVSGSGGCNSFSGAYRSSGAALSVGSEPLAMTAMACTDDGVMEQEAAFTTALTAVAGMRRVSTGLELLDSFGTVVMGLEPVPPVAVEGPTWTLTGLVEADAVSSPAADVAVTLSFADGRLSGKVCNTFGGPYTLKDDMISVGGIMSTRMSCPGEGVMKLESQVLAVLGDVTSVELVQGVHARLTLTAPDGRGLTFTAA
ncbi:MAG: META domain-containing protein [Propionicimonas sp.]|nr:META domain-containing protein [Propionicimonas sp.]